MLPCIYRSIGNGRGKKRAKSVATGALVKPKETWKGDADVCDRELDDDPVQNGWKVPFSRPISAKVGSGLFRLDLHVRSSLISLPVLQTVTVRPMVVMMTLVH